MNRRSFVKSASSLAAVSILDQVDFPVANIRIAVIGHTGRGNYGHGMDTLWLGYPGCQIVAVADPDPVALVKSTERLGGVKGYSDYREMLLRERPEIVSIAPRHIDQHRDMVLASAKAGVKGVYMEKPFCRDLGEAAEIELACKTHGMKLALAHRNRYHPALNAAKRMIEEGKLGKVVEIRGRGKEDHRGGVLDLWVLGSHVLNLIPVFTGAYISCSAVLLKEGRGVKKTDIYEGEEGIGPAGGDRLHARFFTEKGIVVYFDSIKDAGVKAGNFGFQIFGTEGVLDIRIDTEPLVSFLPANSFFPQEKRPDWIPVSSGGLSRPEPVSNIDSEIAGHQAAVRDLLSAVKDNSVPLCNEQEGRATVEAIMAIFESHRRGGEVVQLPLKVLHNPLKDLV